MGLRFINSFPYDKNLDWSKSKAFADDNLNRSQKLKFALGRVENIVGKGENAGYQHFLLFPQCFQKFYAPESSKVGIVWQKVKAPKGGLTMNQTHIDQKGYGFPDLHSLLCYKICLNSTKMTPKKKCIKRP